jgi:hypothetical protein
MLAVHMQLTILATFFEISRTVISMGTAGILIFFVALWAARDDIAEARGLDKVVALSNLCFAAPLAVFGALHLAAARALMTMVPSYTPWPLFWAYFFGFALLAASLSIATKIQVRWSGRVPHPSRGLRRVGRFAFRISLSGFPNRPPVYHQSCCK